MGLGTAGSILKGIGKWQDSGSIGAGVVQASVSFVTFFIPGPDGMDKATGRILVFAKAKHEFTGNVAVGVIEGKSLGEATLSAGVDTVLDVPFNRIKGMLISKEDRNKLLKKGLTNISIPIGLGILDVSINIVKAKGGDATAKQMIGLAKKQKSKPVIQSLKKVAVGSPVLVDLAILGPDRSTELLSPTNLTPPVPTLTELPPGCQANYPATPPAVLSTPHTLPSVRIRRRHRSWIDFLRFL